ncbi:MAG TPA: hypothetical protein VFM70_10975 [Salinimicrobium sp.]|nr:hypothetical protein [Salinimicrobium sp.]
MKQIKLILAFVLVILTVVSCSKDEDSGSFNGSRNAIEDYVTSDLLETMENMGLHVNPGDNPPMVQGSYRIEPCKLIATSVPSDNEGSVFNPVTFELTNLNLDDLSLTYAGSGGMQVDSGTGALISGEGDSVSIFLKLESEISGYSSETIFVLSGNYTEVGFLNFQMAVFMLDNNGNPGGVFIEDGQGRIFIDDNGLVEKL